LIQTKTVIIFKFKIHQLIK